jgi:DNA helicase-2/ATP-dependent DNA helicase PcrA
MSRPDLNPEQELVVEHDTGPLRVGAVAGAGKTTALVERVAWLVDKKKVRPDSILLISFSVNAKNQMKQRVDKRLPGANAGRCARTFHSIGLDIYNSETDRERKEIDSSGYLWLKTMTAAYKSISVEPEKKALKRFASLVKNNLIGTNEALRRLGKIDPRMFDIAQRVCGRETHSVGPGLGGAPTPDSAVKVSPEEVIEAFYRAEEIRSKHGIEHQGAYRTFLTFDDMIYEAAMLLKRKDVRARWAERWRYVLQDECQDENEAQAAIAEALASKHRNYMIVGDPAQSIYGFRGSKPEKMLAFEEEWPGAKTIVMHRNYRSGVEIVNFANAIMDEMPASTVITDDMGSAATMTSERQTHSHVGYHIFYNSREEAECVASNIAAHQAEGVPYKEQAVLLRMNRMTRDIEMALAIKHIPYKMVSGTSFFDLREARILFGYLRLLLDRASDVDLTSALVPVRGLGKAFVKKAAEVKTGTWLDAVREAKALVKPYQGRTVSDWLRFMGEERKNVGGENTAGAYLSKLRHRLKLDDYFKTEGEDAEDSRAAENLDAVIEFARSFDRPEQMLDLVDDIEEHRKKNARKRDAVMISTVHKAKGAEWEVVYVIQVASGWFPAAKADLIEERRCFYVAATRAKDELWISRPDSDDEGRELSDSIFVSETKLKVPEEDEEYRLGKQITPEKIGTQMGLSIY